ncbi:MAG: hypothetical protein HGA90_07210, partial [Alphaproteobacteria bacterium]|nr:hypothetical protein [Alphaproteobacteria bacterium]
MDKIFGGVFKNPDTLEPIAIATDLQSLQQKLLTIPDNSLEYHAKRNHFSKWLNARALFPVAQMFKYIRKEDFETMDEMRRFLYVAISSFRLGKGRGVIAKFDKASFDEYQTVEQTLWLPAARSCAEAETIQVIPGAIASYHGVVPSIPARVTGSILSPNVRVHSYCTIEHSLLMPGVKVNRHARIRRAIIDRDVEIPRGAAIGFDLDEDRKRHTVSDDGVVVVTVGDSPLIMPIPDAALDRVRGRGAAGCGAADDLHPVDLADRAVGGAARPRHQRRAHQRQRPRHRRGAHGRSADAGALAPAAPAGDRPGAAGGRQQH